MDQLTRIELTEEDALLFVKFQKRHAFIRLMESVGAFDIKTGCVKINFDNKGQIGSIDVDRHYSLTN